MGNEEIKVYKDKAVLGSLWLIGSKAQPRPPPPHTGPDHMALGLTLGKVSSLCVPKPIPAPPHPSPCRLGVYRQVLASQDTPPPHTEAPFTPLDCTQHSAPSSLFSGLLWANVFFPLPSDSVLSLISQFTNN